MNRRTYLAALGAAGATAGCVDRLTPSGADSPSGSDPPPGSTPAGDPPADAQRGIALEAVDESGRAHDVSIEVEVVEPWVTPDHPAELSVTTTNEGTRRDLSVGEGGCSLFNRSRGKSDPAGIWLHRAGTTDHVDRPEGRWTRDAPADQPRGYDAYGCLPRTYGSGESVTTAYAVWDDYRVEGYYPPGTYRFEAPVTVSEAGDAYGDESETLAELTWGFSLSVTAP